MCIITLQGDKRGICVVVFYYVVTVLLLLLEVLLFVLTFTYVNNLDLKQTDEICLGVLCLLLPVLVVIYTVGFVDLKHMEGHMAKLYVVLLVLMVLGVMYHFSKNIYLMLMKVKQMPVFEGESVFLPIGVTELQSDDVIQLSFKNDVIATFNKFSSDEERCINRLQVDVQTGSLIITNIRTEDAGLYKVKISSSSRLKSFLQFIISGGQLYLHFSVIVKDSAVIRENGSAMV
ncbi:uncharacterized protein LOC130429857 [Triplophysa dalaica]|uniref:uncharacterized protein LOC130429857 n=1 Tax=Triplophysa dalaica TaxID=1582913 RepID=UPI0024E01D43|nr:uncharacterized protein LOC130429857 [Triplophysa dalaica]